MVKGITRQVMVVKTPETGLFEQAIFLLREDFPEKQGITERQILEEAKRLSGTCVDSFGKKRKHYELLPLVWSGMGAALMGFAWLLTMIIAS